MSPCPIGRMGWFEGVQEKEVGAVAESQPYYDMQQQQRAAVIPPPAQVMVGYKGIFSEGRGAADRVLIAVAFLQIQRELNEMLLRALEVIRWRKPKRPLLLRAGALALQLNNQATAYWAVGTLFVLPRRD
ncbi:hypothetical protein PG988_005151 [Apiospora saccharicola]